MAANAQDPEKAKLIQEQFVLLLHAHRCQMRDKYKEDPNLQLVSLPFSFPIK